MDGEPLEIVADLQGRDTDDRVAVPAEVPRESLVVGLPVLVRDVDRAAGTDVAVGAGNLRGYGVLDQSPEGAWLVRLTAIKVDG